MRDIKVLLYGIRPFMYIGPPHIVYINQFKRKATAFFIIVPSEEYRINGLNYDGGGGGCVGGLRMVSCLFDPVGGNWKTVYVKMVIK